MVETLCSLEMKQVKLCKCPGDEISKFHRERNLWRQIDWNGTKLAT